MEKRGAVSMEQKETQQPNLGWMGMSWGGTERLEINTN